MKDDATPFADPIAWDRDARKVAMSRAFARALRARIPLCAHWSALEYGCGTANLAVALAPELARIVAVDADHAMLSHAAAKLAGLGLDHLTAIEADLLSDPPPELPDRPYDLVFSAMVLHHMENVELLLQRLAERIVPGGHLALFDLMAEDGSFHGDGTIPHHGFDPADLAGWLCGAGFTRVKFDTVHEIERPQPDGSTRSYPVFMVHAVLDG